MFYRQCKIEQQKGNITKTIVSYIPEKYAIVGKMIKLKNDNAWTNDWVVKTVGDRVHEDYLPDSHTDIKAHRRATGDSLRKR